MNLDVILLASLLFAVIWTVMTTRLVRSVIGLALVSVIVTLIIMRFNAPLAGVFELSVCAGLISVIFLTTISFTHRVSQERLIERQKERLSKFWLLPFLLVIVSLILFQVKIPLAVNLANTSQAMDVRQVLWQLRQLDLVGQITILLAGVFGVIIFFREKE